MCSRHFISTYVPVGDAANDYRDVGGRAKQELEPSTGMCEKGAAYGSIQNDEERLASRMTGLYVMPKLLPLVILEAA